MKTATMLVLAVAGVAVLQPCTAKSALSKVNKKAPPPILFAEEWQPCDPETKTRSRKLNKHSADESNAVRFDRERKRNSVDMSGYFLETEACVPDVDCVGSWAAWGTCKRTCGGGLRLRSFKITVDRSGQGSPCVARDEWLDFPLDMQDCNTDPCPSGPETVSATTDEAEPSSALEHSPAEPVVRAHPIDCVESWGAWGACSCSGVKGRTHVVHVDANEEGIGCETCHGSVETAACEPADGTCVDEEPTPGCGHDFASDASDLLLGAWNSALEALNSQISVQDLGRSYLAQPEWVVLSAAVITLHRWVPLT
mmetsp:Transcript_46767/g.69168  ORF Transcript_46767/g.69168 Transcript_46767/m.69168 type:complete len:311 (+) Transcript_46767:67-999(+)